MWYLICQYLRFHQEMYNYILYFRTKPISNVSIIIKHTLFVVFFHPIMNTKADCYNLMISVNLYIHGSWSWSYAMGSFHQTRCEFDIRWWGVIDTTLCEKVYRWLATGRWFPLHSPVSFTKMTDRHDIAEILVKVALNLTTLTL